MNSIIAFLLVIYLGGLVGYACQSWVWETDPDTVRYPPQWMQIIINALVVVCWPITLLIGAVRWATGRAP